ncbi:MAG TPA: polysaccharide deacetylase family protein [Chitinophagaceae bacterium]
MVYFVKKPRWVRHFYGDCTWEMPADDKVIYLTFDDGPDPLQTPFVLSQLEQYGAKATFFCIGRNVVEHPELYAKVSDAGHAIGNHGFSHIDGWKSSNARYFADVAAASRVIESNLFRPPFGHVTWRQVSRLKQDDYRLKTILWSVLSADFDEATAPETCLANVLNNGQPGSIVLFHDSAVASRNMRFALPRVLEHFSKEGYRFEAIRA